MSHRGKPTQETPDLKLLNATPLTLARQLAVSRLKRHQQICRTPKIGWTLSIIPRIGVPVEDPPVIEEYARHNGHADLIREATDGQVGE